jgi:CheY-like chemotaxis protein
VGDSERLVQVVMNLVSNGIKFTDSGFVHLNVDWGRADGLMITVQDSGVGIAAPDIKVLFEAFRQGDDSGRRRFGGTGLGLAITSHLVEMMGGRISVESQLGTGSTFTLTVPLSLPPSESRESQSHGASSVRSGEHRSSGSLHQSQDAPPPLVLCVDESEINLEIARFVLEEAGFAYETAATGEDAIRIAKREPVTMVMMDCHLPDMECKEAAKGIRAHCPGVPIYGMTDEDKSSDHSTYGRRGMQGVVSKPLSPESVAKVVREAHGLPSPRAEEEAVMAERLS